MNKKLLISLSAIGIAAGFWACGSGTVEPMSESDDLLWNMMETQDFTPYIALAKDSCAQEKDCASEMEKARGSAIEQSSSEEPVSSESVPQSSSVIPSSSSIFTFSWMGPLPQSSSSATQPPVVSSSSVTTQPITGLGACAPTTPTVELNAQSSWTFTPSESFKKDINNVMAARYEWTFTGGTPATSTATAPKVSFSTSGQKTVTLKVTAPNGSETINCTPINVNGAPITGCKCVGTNLTPDVNAGESATWTATGCTTKGAQITGYTWVGATADATGMVATAPVSKKGDEVKGVSFTVANDDNSKVTITCENAKAVDSSIPDYIIDGTATGTFSGIGPGEYTMVYACKTDQYYQTPLMVVAPNGPVSGTINGKAFSVSQYGQEKVFSSTTPNTTVTVKITSGSATIKCE